MRTLFNRGLAAVVGSACVLMFAGIVLADDQNQPDRPTPPAQTPGHTPGQAMPGQNTPGQITTDRAFNPDSFATHLRKASEIIGKKVNNPRGEELGEIEDLAIDPERGRVTFVVMDPKGADQKVIAIPINTFETFSGDAVTLNADKATIDKSVTFSDKEWNKLEDMRFASEVYTMYNERPYWEMDTTGSRALRVVKATEILGKAVTNTADENLGDVKELGVDTHQGYIGVAIVEFGGFLGMGDKKVAVPWEAFTFPADDDGKLVLDVTKEKLENAPKFDDNQLVDSKYITNTYGFFGSSPYWTSHGRLPGTNPNRTGGN